MLALRSSPDSEKMKKTVDDLDAWYRQHIQHNRKYSAPNLPLASRRSEGTFAPYWGEKKGEPSVVVSALMLTTLLFTDHVAGIVH